MGEGWQVHDGDDGDHGEPEGGWVDSQRKFDTELQALALCRFSGDPVNPGQPCRAREEGLHPEIDCLTYFISAKAFEEKTLDLAPIFSYERGEVDGADMPSEIRINWRGGEASGVVSGG